MTKIISAKAFMAPNVLLKLLSFISLPIIAYCPQAIAEQNFVRCTPTTSQYGVIDRTGRLSVVPNVVQIDFNNNSVWIEARVRSARTQRNLRKLINQNGNIVPTSDKAEVVGPMCEERAAVKLLPASEKSISEPSYSFCTSKGELLNGNFSKVSSFSHGKAAVKVGALTGFVDLNGALIPKQKLVECDFKTGVVEGALPVVVGNKWGYLSTEGKWLISPTFDEADSFHNGFAKVRIHSSPQGGDSFSFIDKNGKLLKERFYAVGQFENGLAPAAIFIRSASSNGPKWGLIDTNGAWIVKPKFLFIGPLCERTRIIRDGDLYGFMNAVGEITVKPKFSRVGQFSQGLISCILPGTSKVGFFDGFGNVVIPAQYACAGEFNEGLAPVQLDLNGKVGFIDKHGRMVISPEFEVNSTLLPVLKFSEEICAIPRRMADSQVLDGVYFIDKKGQLVTKRTFRAVSYFKAGHALVEFASQKKDAQKTKGII